MTEPFTRKTPAGILGRRAFIRLAGTAAAAGFSLGASSERMRVVGSLVGLPMSDALTRRGPEAENSRSNALIQGMHQRGWVEGVNIRYEIRSSFGGPEKRAAAIKELLDLNPDVILTSSTVETAAMMAATKTIPIIFATANDPVGNGFVESLTRPGGNVTGFTSSTPEMGGKWLELLREAAPQIERVGALFNPKSTPRAGRFYLDSIQSEAAATGVAVTPVPVTEADAIDEAIRTHAAAPAGGMIALVDPFLVINRQAIIGAAAKYRVPMIYPFHYFIDAGGLMSYGASLEIRSADYVDLILRGTKAGDLPVQSPRKYELLINRKVADALGLKLPPSLLARADEIRE
jgi:putative ABC transport system substrate-binding protein